MYQFSPIAPRVAAMRERYRNTQPELDLNRYKLVTEFYMEHRDITGALKRAYNFKNLCEKMPPHVNDGEIIVGSLTAKYRAAAMFPENSVDWLKEELTSGLLWERETDPYIVPDEVREYVLSTVDFWMQECMSAKMNSYIPEIYRDHLAGNGCCGYGPQGQNAQPVGHFCTGYRKAVDKGFKAIKAEADAKIKELEGTGMVGTTARQYNFYRSISIVCEGMITLAKRYSAHCADLAKKEKDAKRKAELEKLAVTLDWVVENPARDFYEAVQALWFYEMCVMLDANMHGTSMGRVDQYLGKYAEADLASGKLTREEAQEIMDMYYLKVAELNKPWSAGAVLANPGYTNGQLFTLGGVDKDGNDATNVCTYMCLEAAGRLLLHDPPQALRIHRNTPKELWDCAIEVTKRAGGVPSFYSDDVVIDALTRTGRIGKEDAWDYCLIGCVEPSLGGQEWPACGGNGTETYTNIVNGFLMAINNGYNPMPSPDGKPGPQFGPATGYLYEMNSIEEVMKAYEDQIRFWTTWDVNLRNIFESIAPNILPQPVVSATMGGCMEKGMDVMDGGSKYNSTGLSCVGVGNVVDCLAIIDHVCFKTKKYTTRELYDAVMANWEGYEEMLNYINGECPRYGNADPEVDKYATFVMESYAKIGTSFHGPRGPLSVGCYPVTLNVLFGYGTWATPDGRRAHTPLSDGIGAVQGMDKSGPTAALTSMAKVPQNLYGNGILQNMKFHPSAVNSEEGKQKLIDLMNTYFFAMGGMQLQLNIVSVDTLRDAQQNPDKYRDLVVRVAGFSAYFVEVFKDSQDDLIRRTEQGL
ncbi:MAG: hypothetical protein HFF09_06160 [Oscillospiraceae bacterium]|nr:hypothetical protein [Oscillospiraceae bacterium]